MLRKILRPQLCFGLALVAISGPSLAADNDAQNAYQEAVQCAAAIQLVMMAAPSWSQQSAVMAANEVWLAASFARAEAAGVAGDAVQPAIIAQIEQDVRASIQGPQAIERTAMQCVASAAQVATPASSGRP